MLRYTQRASSILARFQRQAAACSTDQQASTSSSPSRAYASDDSAATDSIGNEKVQKLAQEIMGLTVLESSWLSEILRKRLNIAKPAFGAMPMGMPMMAASPAGAAPAAETAAPPVEKKEKTEFEVKLTSFTPEGKIKVIKEVRAITGLGLKEAKELVRGGGGQRHKCESEGMEGGCKSCRTCMRSPSAHSLAHTFNRSHVKPRTRPCDMLTWEGTDAASNMEGFSRSHDILHLYYWRTPV